MRPDGDNTLAMWREAGEWWEGAAQREVHRYVDDKGVRREDIREMVPLRLQPASTAERADQLAPDTNFKEEWNLRIHKRRDEKVSKAMGYIQEPPAIHIRPQSGRTYAPLQIMSGYSFGRGTMLAEEIPLVCASVGIPAAAIADYFSLCGVVEFSKRAKAAGVKPIIGATLELESGGRFVLLAKTKLGYENLSQLITQCHLGEPRQFPLCRWHSLERFSRDLIFLSGGDIGPINLHLQKGNLAEAAELCQRFMGIYGRQNTALQIERSFLPWEKSVNGKLLALAEEFDLLPVAGGIVTHARASDFPVQDTIVCADTLCLIDEIIGRKPSRSPDQPESPFSRPERALNAERFLRTPREMEELFADRKDLLENTLRLVDLCEDDVLPARTRLPEIASDPAHMLREVTFAGAFERIRKLRPAHKEQIEHELERIIRLNFADHFLVMWDVCQWAREREILFSGRGSVVDSAVAFCLGISRIDAYDHCLHFDRFLPDDGSKRPDIDIDFEAHRREDVRTYMTQKYGVERVATISAIGTYCTRGIIREVGKVMGLPNETIGFLAKRLHGGVTPEKLESALMHRPELAGSSIPKERFQWVFDLAAKMTDLPRNIRSHSSGVVISSRPLAETVPVQWAGAEITLENEGEEESTFLRIVQWDKRSAKYFFDKFDILCLRGQDVLSGTQKRIRISQKNFNVEQISLEDQETYRTMRSGELIGIPQSASPAMRQAHIRIRTQNLVDASLVQAGIRPGVGGAVKINELIARRRGKPFEFEHPDLELILGNTYGIVVFQEQIDLLLQHFGGYSSGEAEETREDIHKRRREGYGEALRDEMILRIQKNGFPQAVAEHVYTLVSEFKGYGFAQGHALAFAEISVRSIYCQQHFPSEYFAALLDAQPAGYYGPATLVNEARSRGVAILPPCVNQSEIQFKVENVISAQDPKIVVPNGGIRVGLSQIASISKELRHRIIQAQSYSSFFDFVIKTSPNRDELEQLILCGAFDLLCPNRRALLWAIPSALEFAYQGNGQQALPLEFCEPSIDLGVADFSIAEKRIFEREILSLDVPYHLMAFERERVKQKGGLTSREIRSLPGGVKCMAVGNPIRLRFPPTPSGKRVVFFDLEDEEGLLNVTCFDATYQRDGHAIVCSPYVTICGETQDRDGHTAFLAKRVFAYQPKLSGKVGSEVALPITTSDFLVG